MTALEKWKNDFKGFISELSMPEDDYNGILEYIDEVPNETRWIPVNEKLPESSGYYLVTTSGINNNVLDIACYTTNGIWHKASKIKAWMPLPEPYKAESEKM